MPPAPQRVRRTPTLGQRIVALAAIVVALSGFGRAGAPLRRAGDVDALQGIWCVVDARVQLAGDTAQPFDIHGGSIRFTARTVTMHNIGNDPAVPLWYTFTLDTLASPRRIDLVGQDSVAGQTWDGIYRVAGDTLRLTLPVEHHSGANPERAADFSGRNTLALTLLRVTPPPFFPYPGFGRLGCYAGAGLERMAMHGTTPSADAASTGPWLVLDSITAAEDRAANGEVSRVSPAGELSGILIQHARSADTLERTFGTWERVAPDSIAFHEGSMFPPVDWRWRITSDTLVGEGILVSDAVSVDASGVEHATVWRWPVWLPRISCAAVPTAQFTRPGAPPTDRSATHGVREHTRR